MCHRPETARRYYLRWAKAENSILSTDVIRESLQEAMHESRVPSVHVVPLQNSVQMEKKSHSSRLHSEQDIASQNVRVSNGSDALVPCTSASEPLRNENPPKFVKDCSFAKQRVVWSFDNTDLLEKKLADLIKKKCQDMSQIKEVLEANDKFRKKLESDLKRTGDALIKVVKTKLQGFWRDRETEKGRGKKRKRDITEEYDSA
jgi:hypothetical protein